MASLTESRILKADFTSANLTGANLTAGTLKECNFTLSVLTMAKLKDTTLHKCEGFEQVSKCDGADITGSTGIAPRARMYLKRNGAKESMRVQF